MPTTLNDDIKAVMKAKDKETLAVLHMLKAAIQNDRIKASRELNKEEELTVLSREVKQRRDFLSEFEKAERDDLVEKVKIKIAIVERYIPQQLTEEEIRQLVQKVMTRTGIISPKDFDKTVGAMMPKVKGRADSNQVDVIVKELLQEN